MFFVPLLQQLLSNNCTVKDCFDFTQQRFYSTNSKLFMASLNLDSLFTNVPLNETIEIYANELFKSSQTVSSLNKQQVFRDFVNYQIKVFLFDLKYYSQIDGIAMGSPLGPTLVNIFLRHHETTWVKNCPEAFKPVYYKKIR